MAIKNRPELKNIFKGDTLPEQTDYADLIDSMLNRRDDRFFGIWKEGRRYCQGDVVVYGKSLYQLVLPEAEEQTLCADDVAKIRQAERAEEQGKQENVTPSITTVTCICNETPPADDKKNWCELQLETDDNDWQITTDEEGRPIVVYNLVARVGVGTATPGTRLEVKGPAGSIRLDVDGKAAATELRTNGDRPRHVASALTDRADYRTDSLGYAFFRLEEAHNGSGKEAKASKTSRAPAAPPTLLFFLTSEDGRPAAGVATEEPKGILHVEDEDYGRLIVNHREGNEAATVLLVDCTPAGNGHYLLSGVNQSYAYWQTDASQGLRIIMGGGVSKLTEEMGKGLTAVAILEDGKVGIGTEEPRSLLEVYREEMGAVRVDFSNDNVCISTINGRPEPRPRTYHMLGVNDEFGILSTDAPSGFAFKAGRACDDNHDHEVDIDQGETIAYLSRAGRLGLRTNDTPNQFDLHVNGHQLSQTAYLETNGKRIESDGKLDGGEVLEKLEKLHPIYFNWRASANASDAGRQIGFNAQNVFECFPELIRTLGSDKTVAYGNLTAVLTAAIKQQQTIIKDLDQRVCDLEDRLKDRDDKELS